MSNLEGMRNLGLALLIACGLTHGAVADDQTQNAVLECSYLQVPESGLNNLNIDWEAGGLTGQFLQELRLTDDESPTASQGWPLRLGRTELDPRLLAAQSGGQFLSRPRIAIASGGSGTLHLTDDFPIVCYDWRLGAVRVSTSNVGLALSAAVNIDPDRLVSLDLTGNFRMPEELLAGRYLVTNITNFSHRLNVREGELVVIDGLTTPAQFRRAARSIPRTESLLGFGDLFRTPDTDYRLMVMLKTSVVDLE